MVNDALCKFQKLWLVAREEIPEENDPEILLPDEIRSRNWRLSLNGTVREDSKHRCEMNAFENKIYKQKVHSRT